MANKIQGNIADIQAGRRASERLGKLIRVHRDSQALTQTEFARRLRITPQFLCDVELGRRSLGPRKLAELAKLLNGGSK